MLSKLLNLAVLNRRIGYHPLCMSIKLTHLSFADDIMVFTNGSPSSLEGTIEVFDEFARISGLCINIAMFMVFAAGVDKKRLQEVVVSVGCSQLQVYRLSILVCPSQHKLCQGVTTSLYWLKSEHGFRAGRANLSRSQDVSCLINRLLLEQQISGAQIFVCLRLVWTALIACALHSYGAVYQMILQRQRCLGGTFVGRWRKENWGLEVSMMSLWFSLKIIWRMLNGKMSL